MFGRLANCPLCWDGPEICTCNAEDVAKYYENLAKLQKQHKEQQRKEFHKLLDKSFDTMPTWESIESFPVHLARNVFKLLTRDEWIKTRVEFDKHFKI